MSRLTSTSNVEWVWRVSASLIVVSVLCGSAVWIMAHPFPVGWDEAGYANRACEDAFYLRSQGLRIWAGCILKSERIRPPAYRICALPVSFLFGPALPAFRLVCLSCFAASLWFVYRSGTLIAGRATGALAAGFLALCPAVVAASKWYATDGFVYLAVSATCYFLLAQHHDPSKKTRNWIGLGLALGLGAWTKASFLFAALFIMATAFLFCRRRQTGLSWRPLLKSTGLALVVALPWWGVNFRDAIEYARFSSNFQEHSLGNPGPGLWLRWLEVFARNGMGASLALLSAGILIVFLVRLARHGSAFRIQHRAELAICASAVLPMVIAQLAGSNHNIRLVSPVCIPLAVALALMASQSGWFHSRPGNIAALAMLLSQLVIMMAPLARRQHHDDYRISYPGYSPGRVLALMETYDWNPLRTRCRERGIDAPKIAVMGNSRVFNPPQVQYAWARNYEPANVFRLWNSRSRIDWQEVMENARKSDLVLTAADFSAPPTWQRYNTHNAEMYQRLAADPNFQELDTMSVGRFDRFDVQVFIRTPNEN